MAAHPYLVANPTDLPIVKNNEEKIK